MKITKEARPGDLIELWYTTDLKGIYLCFHVDEECIWVFAPYPYTRYYCISREAHD